MDTKWKNVRESRRFKALCVVLSMVLAFSSVALLGAVMRISGLYNNDAFTDPTVAKEGSLVQTTIFQSAKAAATKGGCSEESQDGQRGGRTGAI